MMKTTCTVTAILVLSATALRADLGPGPSPSVQHWNHQMERIVTELIKDIVALNKIVVTDDANNDKLVAAKAELEKAITAKIAKLDEQYRTGAVKKAAELEAAVNTQLKAEKDPAKKDALQEQSKAYQTLRERFLHASLDSNEGMANAHNHRNLFAGLTMVFAFVSAGLMFSRKSAC